MQLLLLAAAAVVFAAAMVAFVTIAGAIAFGILRIINLLHRECHSCIKLYAQNGKYKSECLE